MKDAFIMSYFHLMGGNKLSDNEVLQNKHNSNDLKLKP